MHADLSTFLCLLALAAFPLPAQNSLPGTAPLTAQGDLALRMVDDINAYLLRATAESVTKRKPDRERLKKIIGAVDPRLPGSSVEFDATTSTPALVANGLGYKVYAVRWAVFEGVTAEGLLLEPEH